MGRNLGIDLPKLKGEPTPNDSLLAVLRRLELRRRNEEDDGDREAARKRSEMMNS